MIPYTPGYWGFGILCGLRGSVFPRSLVLGIPNAVLAGLLHIYTRQNGTSFEQVRGVDVLWTGYTFILGFLIVFRNNQAYHRFWEGATLIQQTRGEWFNTISSLIAWCTPDEMRAEEVEKFQNLLIRLMSMLYCAALQQVCQLEDDTLEIIDLEGVDRASLDFLEKVPDRCEVIIQWIQRLIVMADEAKVLKVAPPILSRAYQELSRGIVHLNNARKIKEVPFPFPYAQMITVMLIVHWVMTPVIACHNVQSWWWASTLSFLVTGGFWSLMYIANEIDQPFGDDMNDLPLREMQADMNKSLLTLMHPNAQHAPEYEFNEFSASCTPRRVRSDRYFVSPQTGLLRKDSSNSGINSIDSMFVMVDDDLSDLGFPIRGSNISRAQSFKTQKSTLGSVSECGEDIEDPSDVNDQDHVDTAVNVDEERKSRSSSKQGRVSGGSTERKSGGSADHHKLHRPSDVSISEEVEELELFEDMPSSPQPTGGNDKGSHDGAAGGAAAPDKAPASPQGGKGRKVMLRRSLAVRAIAGIPMLPRQHQSPISTGFSDRRPAPLFKRSPSMTQGHPGAGTTHASDHREDRSTSPKAANHLALDIDEAVAPNSARTAGALSGGRGGGHRRNGDMLSLSERTAEI